SDACKFSSQPLSLPPKPISSEIRTPPPTFQHLLRRSATSSDIQITSFDAPPPPPTSESPPLTLRHLFRRPNHLL
ncbi:hypothetical protein LINPERPRIM_LOCUS35349, partial [Linum perenne]